MADLKSSSWSRELLAYCAHALPLESLSRAVSARLRTADPREQSALADVLAAGGERWDGREAYRRFRGPLDS